MAVAVLGGLLERENELATVDAMLERARAGQGGLVAIEAPAGLGKTALLQAAQERALAAGMQVALAPGFELEREFTFGVLRQLYEPLLATAQADLRARLLDGPAAAAGSAIGAGGDQPPGASIDPMFAVAHGPTG